MDPVYTTDRPDGEGTYRGGHVKLITLIKLKRDLNNLLISQVYKFPSFTTRNATTMAKQQLIESQIGIALACTALDPLNAPSLTNWASHRAQSASSSAKSKAPPSKLVVHDASTIDLPPIVTPPALLGSPWSSDALHFKILPIASISMSPKRPSPVVSRRSAFESTLLIQNLTSHFNTWRHACYGLGSINHGRLSSGERSFGPMNPVFRSASILVKPWSFEDPVKQWIQTAYVPHSSPNASISWSGVVLLGIALVHWLWVRGDWERGVYRNPLGGIVVLCRWPSWLGGRNCCSCEAVEWCYFHAWRRSLSSECRGDLISRWGRDQSDVVASAIIWSQSHRKSLAYSQS